MPVGDGICGAGFNAVAAKDATVVIDVVDLGVTLGAADTVLCSVLCGFDIDAVRRTSCRAQKTSYTFFQSILIALQNVQAAKTFLKDGTLCRTFAVRIVLNDCGFEHLPKSYRHSFGNAGEI